MMRSLKIQLVLTALLVLVAGYLFFNPWNNARYLCTNTNSNTEAKLNIASYLLRGQEVTFKNRIFGLDECAAFSAITCKINTDEDNAELLVIDIQTGLLQHRWEEFESGRYVYDKTQVIKNMREDSYSCEASSA
tara:strand:+ start:19 stop:420 length:402 start_codon:yes stop_codon:yes gene_type:complete